MAGEPLSPFFAGEAFPGLSRRSAGAGLIGTFRDGATKGPGAPAKIRRVVALTAIDQDSREGRWEAVA